MKRHWSFIGGILMAIVAAAACGKQSEVSEPAAAAAESSEIDEASVSTASGVKITVLKTETIGVSPVNKFLWIEVDGRPGKEKLLTISKIALDQIIAKNPNKYHSFTIHFASSEDIRSGHETSKCYARAEFLPEGDWQKVGRFPIDGYGAYRLNCTISDVQER